MMGLGILVALAGYTLVYLGLQNLNGCNAKLLDVITPGKYTPCKAAPSSSSPGGKPYIQPGTTPKTRKARQTAATAPGTPHR